MADVSDVKKEGQNGRKNDNNVLLIVVTLVFSAYILFSLTLFQAQNKKLQAQEQKLDELYNISITINNGLFGLNTKADWIQQQRLSNFAIQNNLTELDIQNKLPSCMLVTVEIIQWIDLSRWIAQYSNGTLYYYANNTYECFSTEQQPISCTDICPQIKPII